MGYEVPLDDIDTENIGGYDKVAPGSYHLEITHVDENGGTKGEMIVKMEVLRGTVANQEGKEIPVYFSWDMATVARRKIHALALAAGVVTKKMLDEHKANKTTPTYDFSNIVGRQVCANFEDNEWNGKHSTRLSWDEIYHPADKRANHIPLLMVKIKAANPAIVLPPNRNPDGAVSTAAPADKKTAPAKPQPSLQAASVEEMLG